MKTLKAAVRMRLADSLWKIPIILAAGFVVTARAQFATEFPADSVPIDRKTFQENIVGKAFIGTPSTTGYWWMEFNADGTFFWAGQGGGEDARWRFEDGLFCGDTKSSRPTCNEVNFKDNQLFYKRRSNGEVVTLHHQPGDAALEGDWTMSYIGPFTGRQVEAKVNVEGHRGTWQVIGVSKDGVCFARAPPMSISSFSAYEFGMRVDLFKVVNGCGIISFVFKKIDDNRYEGLGLGKRTRKSLASAPITQVQTCEPPARFADGMVASEGKSSRW